MSKRIFQHPAEPETGRKYWRSLGQLENTPEFRGWLEREFPQGAAEYHGTDVSRRNFIQLMGASLALAGLTSCRRPEKHLVPFSKGVEWSIPGKALFFATSMPTRRGTVPLVVATHDGRPTKVEGNPLHPAVKGASDTWAQTSILDLYDPERASSFKRGGAYSSEADFDKALQEILSKAGDGSGLALLVEANHSPTRERLRQVIEKKFPKALWCQYDAALNPAAREASETAFGEGMMAVPVLEKADIILSLDADFLSCTEGTIKAAKQFSARRKVTDGNQMNRLYVVENRYTVTGGIADHRLRVPASQIGAFAAALAAQIGAATNDAALNDLVKTLRPGAVQFTARWVEECAADLLTAKGRSLVLVGDRQPAAVQMLGYAINAALGNLGQTLVGRKTSVRPAKTLAELALAIGQNQVSTLFILGGNPVYDAPSDLGWGALQAKVAHVIRLSHHEDETSKQSHWQVPAAHFLESWGDGIASDGSYVSTQPMILPLFGGWSELDLLARIAGQPKPTGPELVQETFRQIAGGGAADFVGSWAKFLREGFLQGSAPQPANLAYNASGALEAIGENFSLPVLTESSFEIVIIPDAKVDDGRYSNNGWLQELPDPITKLTWDNAAWISPASAKKLGVKNGDVVKIEVEGRSIEIPVLEAPGHADNSLTIPLGYGRSIVGRVGQGTGVNAYPLRTSANPYFIVGASVRPVGRKHPLAVTQEHWALEGRGADLTREATLEKYQQVAAAPAGSNDAQYFQKMGMDSHIPKNFSLYANPELENQHQWGMAIDLNTCIGCSSCMVACQAENNIPIVGKEQVINGREMHWLRMDRYFASTEDETADPEMLSQPMMCQHCENAPCETVCPVNATVHSDDGLNVMAYNRCIGTRYCANNCPFKVRRFNFFDYQQRDINKLYTWNLISEKGKAETLKMAQNPNVTVRMRGVMEKCTFCVQRIQEAKIAAKVQARDSANVQIPADSFTVACAQACAADAIVFGDINNPESRVSKLRKSERGYRLLEYLNVASRISYLARIRNVNPKMPGADKITAIMDSHHGPHSNGHGHGHGHDAHGTNGHGAHGANGAQGAHGHAAPAPAAASGGHH